MREPLTRLSLLGVINIYRNFKASSYGAQSVYRLYAMAFVRNVRMNTLCDCTHSVERRVGKPRPLRGFPYDGCLQEYVGIGTMNVLKHALLWYATLWFLLEFDSTCDFRNMPPWLALCAVGCYHQSTLNEFNILTIPFDISWYGK